MGDKPVKSVRTAEYDKLISFMKLLRKEAKLTQRAICNKLGQEKTFLSKIELGSRRIDLIEFLDFCRALDKDPVEVLTRFQAILEQRDS